MSMNVEKARFNMIEQQIRPWAVLDQGVLSLLAVVKREDFVPAAYRSLAFVDMEVPLAAGRRMLAPKIEARLLQELGVSRHEKVLEIGTGSGYMAALLGHRAREVFTVEIEPDLARMARTNLERAAVKNVRVIDGDGVRGVPSEAPFDAILLSGSVPSVPRSLLTQLKVGGRLIAIVGDEPAMHVTRFTRTAEEEFASAELFETVAPRLKGFDEGPKFRF
jgi:protein-L-isoaspartate(D-aspartate) O-methyltransferase